MGTSPASCNLLDPSLDIHAHALLEASAGTGKTFSIEHLVARLIVSGIPVSEILALTFTKKAAKELKERILLNLRALQKGEKTPPYITDIKEAKRRLKFALFEFDFCTIATIHSFAEKILREYPEFEKEEEFKELVSEEEAKEAVETFLRFGLSEAVLEVEEIHTLLKEFRGSEEVLVRSLAKEVVRKERLLCPEGVQDPFAKIASACQLYFRSWKLRHKKFTYDDTLIRLKTRLSSETFLEWVRERYQAVIIDEFQDTDRLQWEIFDTLFLQDPKKRARLFLVGDPKQSIYAFRGADIYTYIDAAKKMGRSLFLKENWRSTPDLVKALNRLFLDSHIPLPRCGSSISVSEVVAAKEKERDFEDGKKALHCLFFKGMKRGKYFPLAQHEEMLLSHVVEDILKLHREEKLQFQKCAILVRDKNQGERVQNYLNSLNIPSSINREEKLSELEVFFFVRILFQAIENPENLSKVKALLASPFYAIPFTVLRDLTLEDLEEALEALAHSRELLQKEGVFSAMFSLLKRELLGCRMESRIVDRALLAPFMQILQRVVEEELPPLECLEKIEREERMFRQEDSSEGIEILTIHASKGLEFDVVFPIGVLTRSFQKERWAPYLDALVPRSMQEVEASLPLLDLELVSEKLRLFYVAMTRAKKRIYLPVAYPENEKTFPEERELSLIECFIKRKYGTLLTFLEEAKGEDSFSLEEVKEKKENAPLLQQKIDEAPLPRVFEKSFSSMPVVSFTQLKTHGKPREGVPHQEGSYPMGSEVGRLLHTLLERITWGKTDLAAISEEIQPYLRGTLLEPWMVETATLIQNAFLAPLEGFSLKDVPAGNILREVNFLYKDKERFIVGVIDLLFSYNDEVWLVDWKSNWLGGQKSDYSALNMQEVMEDEGYTLQSSLYQEALSRYVTQLNLKKPIKGAYFLFLRGLDPEKQTGVFRCV